MNATLADSLIGIAVSNLAFAAPIALLAWWFQTRGSRPFLSHLLWLLVLIKLVTPPFYLLPLAIAPAGQPAELPPFAPSAAGSAVSASSDAAWYAALNLPLIVVGVWLIGSACVLAASLLRAYRFNRLLRQTSESADAGILAAAARLADRLGLPRVPEIRTTSARVSPLVWWTGRATRIYLPATMVERMKPDELGSILSHELGHVRRGDHYVRWLECAVTILLWWNPLAWWARRNLRVCEEICCDAFVLSKTDSSRDDYAEALLSAMELLATPTLRPSGLASHVDGGFIERRIRMILSGKTMIETPRWLRGFCVALAAFVLPLGFSLAQDAGDLDRVQEWLDSGVNSAFLTEEQAEIMMRALRGSGARHVEFNVEEGNGNVIVLKRQVLGNGEEVLLDVEFNGEPAGDPLAFAERSIGEQLASGQITQSEADTLLEELRNSIMRNVAADGSPINGKVRIFAVQGTPIEVNAIGPDRAVTIENGSLSVADAEIVEFTLEREVDVQDD